MSSHVLTPRRPRPRGFSVPVVRELPRPLEPVALASVW
jgi:hypothetical protein